MMWVLVEELIVVVQVVVPGLGRSPQWLRRVRKLPFDQKLQQVSKSSWNHLAFHPIYFNQLVVLWTPCRKYPMTSRGTWTCHCIKIVGQEPRHMLHRWGRSFLPKYAGMSGLPYNVSASRMVRLLIHTWLWSTASGNHIPPLGPSALLFVWFHGESLVHQVYTEF